jgi:5'-nucleotidase
MSTPSLSSLRILVTNDDGVHAAGIFALQQALSRAGHHVTVCAPDRPRSASGHSITLTSRFAGRSRPADGTIAYAGSGTPADCVTLGVLDVLGNDVDLVVSGINHGPNLGWDVTYSGTVSAAMEAIIIGIPAIAVSVAAYAKDLHFDGAANFVATLASRFADPRHKLPPATLLNVNAPDLPEHEIKGVRLTTQGDRQYVDRLEKRHDPLGRPYYWLGGKLHDKEAAPGTDVKAIGEGYISVTPIHLDLTAHSFLRDLKSWDLEETR